MSNEEAGISWLWAIIFILAVVLTGVGVQHDSYTDRKKECNDYSKNGFLTSFEGNFWEFECYVYIEDGRRIPLDTLSSVYQAEPARK